jgi:oxalate decarboxylase/phosphoglucose isomerase-like protein (cupin superfamily)
MKLPFTLNAGAKNLISYEGPAMVQLEEGSGYKVKNRLFENDLLPFMSDDYRKLCIEDCGIVYSGAEHSRRTGKLPNITVLPNLAADRVTVLGSTMGHHQGNPELETQEVYEFCGFGAMIVDLDGSDVILYYAKQGDKVLIPSFCNMTLYNLGEEPLITYDFSDPLRNSSTKDLQKAAGPICCFSLDGPQLTVKMNEKYFNRQDGSGIPARQKPKQTALKIRLNSGNRGNVYEKFECPDVRGMFEEQGILLKPAQPAPRLGEHILAASLFDDDTLAILRKRFFA